MARGPIMNLRRNGLLVVAMTTLLAACGGSVEDRAAASEAPVLIPAQPFSDSYAFTLYSGWQDTYELLYNSAIGSEEFVQAVQFTPEGKWGTNAFSEGLSRSEMDALEQARDDAATLQSAGPCTEAATAPTIVLCVYPEGSFLARSFDTDSGLNWIVANYHDNPAAHRGTADPTRFNPDSIEARFMAADFQLIDVESAAADYLISR